MKQIASNLEMGVCGDSKVWEWVKKFEAHGPEALLPAHHNKSYTKELKEQAVQDYLKGKGSLTYVANQYGLQSREQLRCWIKKYTGLEELKDYHPQPEVYTMNVELFSHKRCHFFIQPDKGLILSSWRILLIHI